MFWVQIFRTGNDPGPLGGDVQQGLPMVGVIILGGVGVSPKRLKILMYVDILESLEKIIV